MKKTFVVAIDGHAGCGKSSICSETSKQNSWVYISTGALYRGLAYLARTRNIKLENHEALEELLSDFCENSSWNEKSQSLFYKKENIGSHLMSEEIGKMASIFAKETRVREKLLPLQRQMINSFPQKIVLVEGRDITTVVCQDAPLKIFMTASIEERASRRLKQLQENKQDKQISLEDLKKEIAERDHNDSSRELAPLVKAQDALLFDTTGLSFADCILKLSKSIEAAYARSLHSQGE